MSRYLIGQALGFVVDEVRERWREVTGIADRERAYARAMVDLATVCDDARRYLRERDAAHAEVERLGDVVAGLQDVTEAARAAWPIVARAVDCDADAVLAERLRLALAAAGLPVDEGAR